MSFDLKTLLSPQNLLGLITTIKGGVPRFLPPGLFSNERPCIGNRGSYRRVKNSRILAPITQHGAAPVMLGGEDVTEIPQILMASKIGKPYDSNFFSNLQALSGNGTPAVQKYAEDVVNYHTAELKRKLTNLKTATEYSILTKGAVYVDSSNNLTLSSGSAAQTYSAGIPAANIDTIANITGIPGTWDDPNCDIPSQLRALKQKAIQTSGYPAAEILYGLNTPGYVRNNTAVAAMVSGNYILASDQYKTTEIPAKLCDYNWHPQYDAFYESTPGTQVQLWDAKTIVVIPTPSPEWQESLRGTTRIPTGYGVAQNALDAMQTNTQDASGMFSYALTDPHGIVQQVAGDCWFPVLTVPASLWIITVAP